MAWGAGNILHIFNQLKVTKNNHTVDLFSSFRTGIAPQSPLPHSQSDSGSCHWEAVSYPGEAPRAHLLPCLARLTKCYHTISFSLGLPFVFWCSGLAKQNSPQGPAHVSQHPFCARHSNDHLNIDDLNSSPHYIFMLVNVLLHR